MTDTDRIHDRTPFITIELQLRPSPPVDARPYWWGYGMLTFYDDDHNKLWERDLHLLTERSCESARVRAINGAGWVLVLTLTHDRAKAVLDGIHLPHFVDGSEP